MGVFDRLKRHQAAGSSVVPPARSSSVELTPAMAMSLAAVYRAVSIIVTTATQLPLNVYRGVEPVQSNLAHKPDVNTTRGVFWQETFLCLAIRGEAFWWVTYNARGEATNLTVISPNDVSVELVEATIGHRPVYHYRGREVAAKNLRHIKLLSVPGEPRGLGPVQAARADIESALRLREYGNAIFDVGQVPTGVLSTDQFISQEQADQYRDRWNEVQRERGVAVLGSGMAYQPILLNPEDAQFIANQQWTVNQVARLFGIPTLLLASGVDGTSLTYSNSETLFQQMLTTTLINYLEPCEEAFSTLLPRGQDSRFKVDALLRSDITARVTAYEKLVTLGAMLPAEVRASEGMDPMSTGRVPDNADEGVDLPPVPDSGPVGVSNDGSPT